MNSFSALRKYDLEIRFNRRDLYQTLAFCGHVFTTKLQLKKITLGHMTENKCGYQMHIFVTSFSTHWQYAPVWRCFCLVQPLRQPFRPKCTNRILQMHHQNPVVPSESGVHPQNPVCTYSVIIITNNLIPVTATGQVTVILDESICCVQINRKFIGHIEELSLSTGYGISYWHR